MSSLKISICSIICAFASVLLFTTSCSKDEKKEAIPEYVGKWYRDAVSNYGKEAIIVYFSIYENSYTLTTYEIKGENLDLLYSAKISNVRKTSETHTFVHEGNLVTLSEGGVQQTLKYSVINNQLILTDIVTGDLYGLIKVTDEIQSVIDNLNKIAI